MSDNIDSALRDFLRTTRTMETNIVSVISDSNRDIEMILKELLIYLDATSKNLEKVQGSLIKFVDDYEKDQEHSGITTELNNIIQTIKAYSQKISEIDTQNAGKIIELVKLVGTSNQKFLKQILIIVNKITQDMVSYDKNISANNSDLEDIKDLLKVISIEVKDTKINVSKNQENLMTVISNIMDTSVKKTVAKDNIEVQKIKSDEEKFKTKMGLLGKIIGIVLGSGGIIYLLIDILFKSGG